MSLITYSLISVYVREGSRWRGRPLHEEVVRRVRDLKLCARCLVLRASEGCFESGETATSRILVLSGDLPIKIEILLPEAEAPGVLEMLDEMVSDGLVAVAPLPVAFHRAAKQALPNHLRVRDVMTAGETGISPETSLKDALPQLLKTDVPLIPVTGSDGAVMGILTETDLIDRGGLPLRVPFLNGLEASRRDVILADLEGKAVRDVMTAPAVTVGEDDYLPEVVKELLEKGASRLPVVSDSGKFVGIVTRLDLLKAITQHVPDWYAAEAHPVEITQGRSVSDRIVTRGRSVRETTPLGEVLEAIFAEEARRIAVVDGEEKPVGIIGEGQLLKLLPEHSAGIWELLTGRVTIPGLGRRFPSLSSALHTARAADVMEREFHTIAVGTSVEAVAGLIAETHARFLVVTDGGGRFTGWINRTDVLRASLEEG